MPKRAARAADEGRRWLTVKARARQTTCRTSRPSIPLGTFTCVTGVSGGGKSTLSDRDAVQGAATQLNSAREHPGAHDRHRRCRPSRQDRRHRPVADRPHAALQPGDLYRRLLADPRLVRRPAGSQGARLRSRAASRSTSRAAAARPARATASSRSRCTSCPTSTSPCDVCKGKRYNRETLEIHFKRQVDRRRARHDGRGRRRVLQGRAGHPRQAPETLAAGRPRLHPYRPAGDDPVGRRGAARQARQGTVARAPPARTLYILDEPTTGLHFEDVRKLLEVLHRAGRRAATPCW